VQAVTDVATAQEKAGDKPAARATLSRAVEAIMRIPDEDERFISEMDLASTKVESLASLAKCQVKIGEKVAARDTVTKALPLLDRLDLYNVLLPAHAVAEVQISLADPSAAKKTMADAARKIRVISDTADRAWEANLVASAQIDLGLADEALATLREITMPLVPLSNDRYGDGRDRLAVLLARAGDLAAGYRIARQVKDEPDYTIRTVAGYHVVAKGADEALALAEKQTDPVLRTRLYHGIAIGLLHRAKVEASTSWTIDSCWLTW
jgi:hypothetical protein